MALTEKFLKPSLTVHLNLEDGPSTGTNLLVISDTHSVRTNPEVKIAIPIGVGLDPGGWANLICPNLLAGFGA